MTVILLRYEFYCWPLWLVFPDKFQNSNIDPAKLPISEELQARLISWSDAYDATLDQNYPPDSGFKNQEEVDAFRAEGVYLGNQLRKELDLNFHVIVSNIDVNIRTI